MQRQALWAAARFLGRSFDRAHTGDWPSLSVLKPLKGADRELYEALRSHCLQDYPQYEILFGITEANDPAAVVVRKSLRRIMVLVSPLNPFEPGSAVTTADQC